MPNSVIKLFSLIFFLLAFEHPSRAQSYPQDFEFSYITDIMLDAGLMWENNSTFHPLNYIKLDSVSTKIPSLKAFRWTNSYLNHHAEMAIKIQDHSSHGLGLILIPGIGFSNQDGDAANYRGTAINDFVWVEAHLKNSWYTKIFIRSTNETESIPHYTGIAQDISRTGFSTGEIDQSILGFKSQLFRVEYGRSREIWGPFAESNLLLAGNSPAFDRIMIQMTYQRFSYRWFYGFLETLLDPDGNNINRYIVGRAVEYNNHRNMVLSLGEVSILSGKDRSLDWSFLNPFAAHLEIEQNHRENIGTGNQSNEIIFFNVDWLPAHSLRLSGSFVLDDIQVDQIARDKGYGDALGWIGRFAWTPLRNRIGITAFGYFLRVDSYTLQHESGWANMVSRGELIGHPLGNDTDDFALGVRSTFLLPTIFEMKIGQRRWGDNSLLYDPYSSYDRFNIVSFPKGEIRTNRYIATKILYQPHHNLNLSLDGHLDIDHSGSGSALEVWTFSMQYQLPFLWQW